MTLGEEKMQNTILFLLISMISIMQLSAGNVIFNVETSEEEHAYGSAVVLENRTGKNASDIKVLWMHQIDPEGDCVPGNVREQVLSFVEGDDPVALPVAHFRFTLVVYKEEFLAEANDRDALSSATSIFEYHGDAVYRFCDQAQTEITSVRQVRLVLDSA